MLEEDATAVPRPRRCDNREQCAAGAAGAAPAAAEPRAADTELVLPVLPVLRVSPTAGLGRGEGEQESVYKPRREAIALLAC